MPRTGPLHHRSGGPTAAGVILVLTLLGMALALWHAASVLEPGYDGPDVLLYPAPAKH